jgi:hypothetical protein
MEQEKANKIASEGALQSAIKQRNAAQDRTIEAEAQVAVIQAITQELEVTVAAQAEQIKAQSEQIERLLQEATANRAASEVSNSKDGQKQETGAALDSAPKV